MRQDTVRGRVAGRLGLVGALLLTCAGPADALTSPSPVTAGLSEGLAGGSVGLRRNPRASAASEYLVQVAYPSLSYPSLSYPPATYGPQPATPAPAAAPAAPQIKPPTGPTGGRCEAVLFLADRNMFCALKTPRALGAPCVCPYPPAPAGLKHAPPQPGHVIS